MNRDELINQLSAKSSNAYLQYIRACGESNCLGWEAKVENGSFGEEELKAHKKASELLGRHRAYSEAAKLLKELEATDET